MQTSKKTKVAAIVVFVTGLNGLLASFGLFHFTDEQLKHMFHVLESVFMMATALGLVGIRSAISKIV